MPEEHHSEIHESLIQPQEIDRMIGGALNAMIKAQVNANWHYVDFLQQVCFPEGKAEMLQFDYDELLVDSEGRLGRIQEKTLRLPLVAAVTHPNIVLEAGSVDFDFEVTHVESDSTTRRGLEEHVETPSMAALKGHVLHKATETRKTDKRAKFSIHAEVKREAPPESLMRIIDFLTDAATQPLNSWLLRRRDLIDPAGFLIKLRDSQDRVSHFLKEQFPPETRRLLDEYTGPSLPQESLQQAVLQELNRLLQSESLYDEQRFEDITLREQTRRLLDQNPQGNALLSLNRWLLEDAYPQEIAKNPSYVKAESNKDEPA